MQLPTPTIGEQFGGPQSYTEIVARAEGSSGADPALLKKDMVLAHAVNATLQRHYPGYPWGVVGDESQGIAQIFLTTLSKYCWVLHTKKISNIGDFERKVKHAGGEFLSRFGLKRGPCDLDEYLQVLANLTPEMMNMNPDDM